MACPWFWLSMPHALLLISHYCVCPFFFVLFIIIILKRKNLLVQSIWTNKLFLLFFGLLSSVLDDSSLSTIRLTCDSPIFVQVMTSTSFVSSKWLQSSALHHGHLLRLIEDSRWSIHHSFVLHEQTRGGRRRLESPSTAIPCPPSLSRWWVESSHELHDPTRKDSHVISRMFTLASNPYSTADHINPFPFLVCQISAGEMQ